MNLDQLKHILSTIEGKQPDLKPVIEAFEQFMELYAQRNQPHKNEEKFKKNLDRAYSRLWDLFEVALANKGWSINSIQQHLTNPSNFAPEQWARLEQMKEDIRNLQAPIPQSRKRLKKSKNVRI